MVEELQREGKAGLVQGPEDVFGSVSSVNMGKFDSDGASPLYPRCPECGSSKTWRDGWRYSGTASVQRFLCRTCGFRFSDPIYKGAIVSSASDIRIRNASKTLKSERGIVVNRQICVSETKNLRPPIKKHVGAGVLTDETKAVIKVFEGWMQKEGYKPNRYGANLKTLVYLGADLMNPEDVKAKIGAHKVRDGMKMLLCYAYEAFLKMNNMTWNRPTYKQDEIIPFVAETGELEQLIAASHSKRMAAYLQTLKETFTDPSEAIPIEWDIDINGKYITIRHPVKGHRPRTIEVTDKLIAMLNALPRNSKQVFNCKYSNLCAGFLRLKQRVAATTKNPRFLRIELTSFRTWGGTHIAEMSNGNPITVMKMLGLKSVENAMKYVNIWKLSFRTETEYEYLAVTTPEELKVALLGGYQFVIDKFGASWFRRTKRIAIAGTPVDMREPEKTPLPSVETSINKRKPTDINAF